MKEDGYRSLVRSILIDILGEEQVSSADPNDTLSDLGVDSIMLVSLAASLEQQVLNRPLADEEVARLRQFTLDELDGLVEGSVAGSGRLRAAETSEAPSISVRAFRPEDRDEMAELCRRTCARPAWREVAHLLWLYQYLDQEPNGCFVGEFDNRIVAYWVGTCDDPRLATRFGEHVRRYLRDFIDLYPNAIRSKGSVRDHLRLCLIIIGGFVHPRWAFRLFNRRDLLGPALGMTRAHFQVSSGCPPGIIFELARMWLKYLATMDVDITCLPSVPGGTLDESGAISYWRRLGYHPVKVEDRTILVAMVKVDGEHASDGHPQ